MTRSPKRPRAPRVPGSRWRVLAEGMKGECIAVGTARAGDSSLKGPPSVLDEVVVDGWLHLEQMSRSEWWMELGDARIWIKVLKDGRAEVYIDRGEYGPALGRTGSVPKWALTEWGGGR